MSSRTTISNVKKSSDDEKKGKHFALVHSGLFRPPTKQNHSSLKFGEKMISQRWPKFFYPNNPLFNEYKKLAQPPEMKIISNFMYCDTIRTFPNKVYLFSHVMIPENKQVNKVVDILQNKTNKLEPGNTYSIPDVGRFKIDRKLGNNGYAAVSKNFGFGKCYLTFEAEGKNRKKMPCQFLDVRFYLSIKEKSFKHRKHFLQIHVFGHVPDRYHWAVFELGGPNLNDLFTMCNKKWSKPTLILVAAQTLQAVHDVQLHHHMHRCIDPHSFIVGAGNKHKTIYIIDFSHSYEFTKRSRAQRKGEKYSTETPRVRWKINRRELFAPRSYHTGSPYRRIDDVESWFLMVLYFIYAGTTIQQQNCFRTLYYEKCHWLYGGNAFEEDPSVASVFKAIVQGIDQYDENTNTIVDFPYFSVALEHLAMQYGVFELPELLEWMPSSKDSSRMVLRGGVAADHANKGGPSATTTLTLPNNVKKN